MKAVSAAWRNQPSQTLSPSPFFAHPVHAVVPVAGSHQRKSVRAKRKEASSARAQCSKTRRLLVGDGRIEEAVMLARLKRLAFEEGALFHRGERGPR